ncbi:MAG: hypothetical protein ACI9C1_001206 [Candidatus Aldehydirespiratoraceae bacterium]|jgi:hypothetical protein
MFSTSDTGAFVVGAGVVVLVVVVVVLVVVVVVLDVGVVVATSLAESLQLVRSSPNPTDIRRHLTAVSFAAGRRARVLG